MSFSEERMKRALCFFAFCFVALVQAENLDVVVDADLLRKYLSNDIKKHKEDREQLAKDLQYTLAFNKGLFFNETLPENEKLNDSEKIECDKFIKERFEARLKEYGLKTDASGYRFRTVVGVFYRNQISQQSKTQKVAKKVVNLFKKDKNNNTKRQLSGLAALYSRGTKYRLIIGFLGSYSVSDWIKDLNARIVKNKTGLKTHKGFWDVAYESLSEMEMTSMINKISKIARRDYLGMRIGGPKPAIYLSRKMPEDSELEIIFTGHSLGGAQAAIFTFLTKEYLQDILKKQGINISSIKLITYGAPPVFTNESGKVAEDTIGKENIIRVVDSEDPVPVLGIKKTKLPESEFSKKLLGLTHKGNSIILYEGNCKKRPINDVYAHGLWKYSDKIDVYLKDNYDIKDALRRLIVDEKMSDDLTNEVQKLLKQISCGVKYIRISSKLNALLKNHGIQTNSNWMSKKYEFIKDIPLTKLYIPGSNDSGTYAFTSKSKVSNDGALPKFLNITRNNIIPEKLDLIAKWSKTQNLDIYQQLKAGVRYFDLRVEYSRKNDSIYLCHGLRGNDIADEFKDIKLFLKNNPNEVIILDINHFYAFDNDAHTKLLKLVCKNFDSMLVNRTDWNNNISTLTLKKLRGRKQNVIVLYGSQKVYALDDAVNAYARKPSFAKSDNLISSADILNEKVNSDKAFNVDDYDFLWNQTNIISYWANKANIEDLIYNLETFNSKRTNANCFNVVQYISSINADYMKKKFYSSLETMTSKNNKRYLNTFLNRLDSWSKSANGNIILSDFYDETTAKSVIDKNDMAVSP